MLRIALPIRVPSLVVLVIWMHLLSSHAFATGPNSANLTVTIVDKSHAYVADASSVVTNTATGVRQESHSTKTGTATFPFLTPGKYTVLIHKDGFASVSVDNVVLNVGDDKTLEVTLQIGAQSETVSVNGDQATINTTDGSVSTVIDRKFVDNTPLNGRSFQSLILLTPGTVTNSPQRSSTVGATGEFSVNGQRTESNYYTVDGVSANSGSNGAANGAGPSGSISASTALGTTQALVSVDALQEFRVESSTYSAEFGRSPGGQFSMVTRSGTNDWHGTAFDYFRNDALDANSWFNDNTVPPTRKTPERQNDFGGVLGGPIRIPYLYNGINRSFFFFSYEGLRLMQPVAASINPVPDIALRQSVTGALQQVLNAYPLPTANAPDLGNGLGEFIGSWSNPSQVDATSLRLDHSIGQRAHVFFRFSLTPSSSQTRANLGVYTPSANTSSTYAFHTYTFGATLHIMHNVDSDFRLNFSSNTTGSRVSLDTFGGAVPLDLYQIQGATEGNNSIGIGLNFPGGYQPRVAEAQTSGQQQQWNLVDTVNIERGRNTLKVGVDWRRLPSSIPQSSPIVLYIFSTSAAVSANSISKGSGQTNAADFPVYNNFSLFAQDTWRPAPRLSISAGIRWEVNPAPGVTKGILPYTVTGLSDLSTLALAPQGTPLWNTGWYNFAPRLGVAYVLNHDIDYQTVIRGGGGVFFDTGQQTGSYGFQGVGTTATNTFGTAYNTTVSFPAPLAMVTPTIIRPPTTPYGAIYTNPAHFALPYTLQWNVSMEQALGRSQSLTLSYVGANGRKLIEEAQSSIGANNPKFTTLYVFKNGLTSSYNALQVQYQKQISTGLQAIASYTWSHALDFGSYNAAFPYQHGNSDQDVRHNLTAAVSYDLPQRIASSRLRTLLSESGIDARFTARTGFPVILQGNSLLDPNTGQIYFGGLNVVPSAPLFLYGSHSTYPGGRRINPAAFSLPSASQFGDAPRNFVRGFGAAQADIAIRRSFPVHDQIRLLFRAESFNVSNHPNFGTVNATYGNVQFGEATTILSQSLGVLSPLYQMGGPRSLQLSLKLTY